LRDSEERNTAVSTNAFTSAQVPRTNVKVKGTPLALHNLTNSTRRYTESQLKLYCRNRVEYGWTSIADDVDLKFDLCRA
jgi:hypothetical protein